MTAAPEFRTAWFLESIATQIMVVFVIRTHGLPWKTPPDRRLVISSMTALVLAVVIPLSGIGGLFAFTPLSAGVLISIGAITLAYLVTAQSLKRFAMNG